MFTPYDWQEGIGNRAQYIEAKLAQGAPVLAVSLEAGILVFTYRRQTRKIFEIYDRLIFAAVGQQSDIEAMRSAALEFASREGYNRSEEDVTIQRVATAMSAPLKRAFADFGAAPIVARSLFAEIGETPDKDVYYVLDYDGDYAITRRRAAVAPTLESGTELEKRLEELGDETADGALEKLKEIWLKVSDPDGELGAENVLAGITPEAVLLERKTDRVSRFQLLIEEDI